jgi:hypothetical protein
MGDRKLTSPRVVVLRLGHDDLELQTNNADMVRWDLTRPKQRPPWPTFQDAPILWLTFLAWAAARRTGAIEQSLTFETWCDDVQQVSTVDDPEAEEAGTGAAFPPGQQGTADM